MASTEKKEKGKDFMYVPNTADEIRRHGAMLRGMLRKANPTERVQDIPRALSKIKELQIVDALPADIAQTVREAEEAMEDAMKIPAPSSHSIPPPPPELLIINDDEGAMEEAENTPISLVDVHIGHADDNGTRDMIIRAITPNGKLVNYCAEAKLRIRNPEGAVILKNILEETRIEGRRGDFEEASWEEMFCLGFDRLNYSFKAKVSWKAVKGKIKLPEELESLQREQQ